MVDGVIDIGIREVFDVYVKLLENGKAVNIFVVLKECLNGKVQGIIEVIILVMDEKDWNQKDKIVCFGIDGVNVMVGQYGGVFGILN